MTTFIFIAVMLFVNIAGLTAICLAAINTVLLLIVAISSKNYKNYVSLDFIVIYIMCFPYIVLVWEVSQVL